MMSKIRLFQIVAAIFLSVGMMVVPAHAQQSTVPARSTAVAPARNSGLSPTKVAQDVRKAVAHAPDLPVASAYAGASITHEAGIAPNGGLWANRFGDLIRVTPMLERQAASVTLDNFVIAGNFAARADGNGLQSLAVLADKQTPAPSWQLSLPTNTHAAVQEDGSIVFLKVADRAVMVLDQRLEKPWAVDATGRLLPTHYEIAGNSLIQHVDTTGATFPVISDPRLTFGRGIYLNLWGYELRAAAVAIIAAGSTTAVAVCSGLTKLPAVLAKIAAVVCLVVGAPTLKSIWKIIVQTWRSSSINDRACYQMRIVPNNVTGLKRVANRNCSR